MSAPQQQVLMAPHNFEAEQSVLGAVMQASHHGDSDRVTNVLRMLKPDSFYSSIHVTIFNAMRDLAGRNQPLDLVTLDSYLTNRGESERVGGFSYLIELQRVMPSSANAVSYAMIVREHAARRFALRKLADATELLTERTGERLEGQMAAVQGLLSEIHEYTRTGKTSGLRHIRETAEAWVEEISQRMEDPKANAGYTSGIQGLDDLLYPKMLRRGSLVVVGARPKMGKEQPLHSKILLADGTWTTMGDITMGAKLASIDGEESFVTGIFPQGRKTTYRVTFTDGRSTECGIDHLWTITSSRFKGERTVNTAKLIEMLGMERYKGRITVPGVSGDFGSDAELGVNPWLLGALLGDGCLTGTTPKISASEPYIVDRVKAALPASVGMSFDTGVDYRLSGVSGKENELTANLKALGAYGVKSPEKSIPASVFSASREVRESVLAGLLETDGWCEKYNALLFASSSRELAEGVQQLVRSLGGFAKIRTKSGVTYTNDGVRHNGLDSHIVGIRLADNGIINSPRLLARLKESKRSSTPYISSIEESGVAECQCIMVSHESHLYVTDDYVVTHNTAFLLRIMIHFACEHQKPVGMFSLEMPTMELWERMVSQEAKVNSNKFYTGMDDADFGKVEMAMSRMINTNLFVDDTPGITLSHLQAEARKLKAREGSVGCIAVDYLTLMKAEKADRNDLAYGMITKGLKDLAKELDCPVFLLTQLNRGLEQRQDKRPMPSDSRDTGQIEQDCDLWIGLYRDSVYNEEAPLPGATEAIVRLNRHGKSGTSYMNMVDGAFYDLDQSQIGRLLTDKSSRDNGGDDEF